MDKRLYIIEIITAACSTLILLFTKAEYAIVVKIII